MATRQAFHRQAEPRDEKKRLEIVEQLGILQSPPSPYFDAIVKLAADLFECPIALVSIIGKDEQWHMARYGIDLDSVPRIHSFCEHTMRGQGALIVENTAKDARFRDNPLVSGPPRIGFYAGYPIKTDNRYPVGAFCIKDTRPRRFTDDQRLRLEQLGRIAEGLVRAYDSEGKARKAQQFGRSQTTAAQRQAELLEQVTAVSGVGGWELPLDDMTPVWTDKTRKIHEVDESYVPTIEEAIRFYPPEARPALEKAIERCIETGREWNLELPFITAKKKRRWVHTSGKAVMENGRTVRLVGAFRDITGQKKGELKLRESERQARAAREELAVTLANMHEGVCVFDKDGLLNLWNRQYVDIFNKPEGEVKKGMSFRSILQNETRRGGSNINVREMTEGLKDSFAKGRAVPFHFRLGNGKSVSATYAPIPDGGWVATYSDVTDKMEAAQRIEHAANQCVVRSKSCSRMHGKGAADRTHMQYPSFFGAVPGANLF